MNTVALYIGYAVMVVGSILILGIGSLWVVEISKEWIGKRATELFAYRLLIAIAWTVQKDRWTRLDAMRSKAFWGYLIRRASWCTLCEIENEARNRRLEIEEAEGKAAS